MTTEHSASSIEYLHPTTPAPPGPFATLWLAPWPWWCWVVLLIVVLAPAVYFTGPPLNPAALYMWPVAAVYVGGLSLAVFGAVAGIRAVTRDWLAARLKINEV